jgi:PKHD-type hydroxylase
MSIYSFAPAQTFKHNHPFISWDDAFTDEELERLKAYAKSLPMVPATVNADDPADSSIRVSNVAWIGNNDDTNWFYERLAFVARQINAKFYGFDLYGFVEDMQFTVYEGDQEAHYTWHYDASDIGPSPRKLSLVLQLSDPSEYEGGELQTFTQSEPNVVEKKKGMIAAFPAYMVLIGGVGGRPVF